MSKVDHVVLDVKRSVQEIIRALDGLTITENFAPEGEDGQVLVSRGTTARPTWMDASDAVPTADLSNLDANNLVSGYVPAARLRGAYPDLRITNLNVVADAAIAWSKIDKVGSSINDLSDVTITSPAASHVIGWSGTEWVNEQLAFSDISGIIASAQVSGSYTGITGVGTITTGIWQGSPISTAYTAAKVTSVAGRTGAITLTVADIGVGSFPTGTITIDQLIVNTSVQLPSFVISASGAFFELVDHDVSGHAWQWYIDGSGKLVLWDSLMTGRAVYWTNTSALFGGTIQTADPGSGAGAWKLGTYQAASVTPDGNYIEVDVDGTVYKLATAA